MKTVNSRYIVLILGCSIWIFPKEATGQLSRELWGRMWGRKIEWGVVLAGIKKMELDTVASLKIVIAIVILLQRMMRGNAVWDAGPYTAMKTFSKCFAKIPLEGRS